MIGWLALPLGLLARVLLGRRRKVGWLFAFAAGVLWATHGFLHPDYPIVATSVAYLILDGLGYYQWRAYERAQRSAYLGE